MKTTATIFMLAALFSSPANAEEKWKLTGNSIQFGGAKFEPNSMHASKTACEKERAMILDYLREMQPQLVPLLKMTCVAEATESN